MIKLKVCCKCMVDKPTTEFNKNSHKKDGLQTYCKLCSSKNSAAYYKSKTDYHKNETKTRKAIIRKRNLQYIWDWLSNHQCIDCGNSNPIVLEFDHIIGNKFTEVSKLVQNESSIELIQIEIDKCEVRCANCHRIKTAKQLNWYKNIDTGIDA